MKEKLLVKSSSGGSYQVELSDEQGALQIFCHCQAGSMQQMCRHKLALINGDRSILFNDEQEKLFNELMLLPSYKNIKRRYKDYENQIAQIESDMKKLKDKERNIKADFAYELTHGKNRNN